MLLQHLEMHSEKMYNTYPPILIKFWLVKGVNYTHFYGTHLTNNKKQTKKNPKYNSILDKPLAMWTTRF